MFTRKEANGPQLSPYCYCSNRFDLDACSSLWQQLKVEWELWLEALEQSWSLGHQSSRSIEKTGKKDLKRRDTEMRLIFPKATAQELTKKAFSWYFHNMANERIRDRGDPAGVVSGRTSRMRRSHDELKGDEMTAQLMHSRCRSMEWG